MKKERRNIFFDTLKYFAIFLVIWGHVIQHTCMLENVYNDYILRFIYTVHMPLLMGISGYFLGKTIRRIGKDMYLSIKLPARLKSLFIPMFSFGLLKFMFSDEVNQVSFLRSIHGVWFIGDLAINYLITILVIQFCNGIFSHDWKYYLYGLPLTLIPFIGYGGKGLFMYLFFVIGYCLSYYCEDSFLMFEKYWIRILFVYLIAFILYDIMPFEPISFTINYAKYTLLGIVVMNFLKIVMAICGCYLFILLVYKILPIIKQTSFAQHVFYYGQHTLEIYLLQIIIVEIIGKCLYFNFVKETGNNFIYSKGFFVELVLTFIFSCIIMKILTILCDLINMNTFLTTIFFGSENKKKKPDIY